MDAIQVRVKREVADNLNPPNLNPKPQPSNPAAFIDLSSSDSDSDDSSSSSSSSGTNGKRPRDSCGEGSLSKKSKKQEKLGVALPLGFLEPLPPKNAPLPALPPPRQLAAEKDRAAPLANGNGKGGEMVDGSSKQFWKAGDFEDGKGGDWDSSSGGMDHVRVHPKFLHSNATSHKWVLGAFAELLDNSLDEVCNGATFVNLDMVENKKDGSRMLLIEDNGGGMNPDKLRHCMSLGYSVKSKIADTIGQYGNGFKTSTMRLGADVIVFSRCVGQDGKRPTQSIGLLSYTFLRSTGKEDIVVPMLDYEGGGQEWNRMRRSSASDWNTNVETILQWSPFSSEAELLQQFNQMKDHGTRIIIYNLWEDDQGQLELDFDTDPYDIQIRGVNRDENKILMAKRYPNSKHFLTYRHSLRSYASILYLRIPPRFRIILRGKDVVHHNIVNDMMQIKEMTYRPQHVTDGVPNDSQILAVVTIGFVKDAKYHIDVQGFNVYHKNRLIKPFWRIWNAAGSDGRGVIGVLEADFVEPAHDKQGFERTTVLSRLETRLLQMQKDYWRANAHTIGYAARCSMKERATSLDYLPGKPSRSFKNNAGSSSKVPVSVSEKLRSPTNQKQGVSQRYLKTADKSHANGHAYTNGGNGTETRAKLQKGSSYLEPLSPSEEDVSDNEMHALPKRRAKGGSRKEDDVHGSTLHALERLKEENRQLTERLKQKEEVILGDLQRDIRTERDRCKSLETKLEEASLKIEEMNKEQENLIDIFSEERERRDIEEENLRTKLKEASNTIKELIDKVRRLEKTKNIPPSKVDYLTLEKDR
ncbi:protein MICRORCHIDIA 7-like isoform X2 [Rhododendron vialii]|uniref:protein MICRORCHIDIA 7-like isoform X2 n=1 Tax=Rhododendron vialii TaxID=182163 RepID=UPI00265D79E1|nr:protein MICRORCHIDIA 7-like isoform X2 [Rhododendron vialii]